MIFIKNIIEVKIKGPNINNFIKKIYQHKINIYKISKKGDEALIVIDYDSYLKLDKIKTYYEIEFIRYLGYKKILLHLFKNKIYYFFILVGFLIIFFLSRITFNIKIITNDTEMNNLLLNELKENGIYKYSFLKNYDELSKIKQNIINKYEDKIEWLEIEKKGTTYLVRFEPKIKNDILKDNKIYDIVASKNALILRLDIESGQILKNFNEYVHINDMIISSDIKLFDETKSIINAKGNVYGEVWYKVNVKYPINYYEEVNTGNSYQTFSLNIFNKKILLKNNNYLYKKYDVKPIIKNNILPISLNKEVIYEYEIIDSHDYQNKALELGLNKIRDNLHDNEYIIDYSILSYKEENNIYEINIFVSVCENIGIYKERVDLDEGNV